MAASDIKLLQASLQDSRRDSNSLHQTTICSKPKNSMRGELAHHKFRQQKHAKVNEFLTANNANWPTNERMSEDHQCGNKLSDRRKALTEHEQKAFRTVEPDDDGLKIPQPSIRQERGSGRTQFMTNTGRHGHLDILRSELIQEQSPVNLCLIGKHESTLGSYRAEELCQFKSFVENGNFCESCQKNGRQVGSNGL